MKQDRFDELMNDARDTFRAPPSPDFDGMWREIEARGELNVERLTLNATANRIQRSTFNVQRIALIAATLVIGILIGRSSTNRATAPTIAPVKTAQVASANTNNAGDAPFDIETSRYLGQTAALLIALPSEVKSTGADTQFVARAGDLLTRTRLLMDSPAANDPQMKSLLDDLELVLAQVVRLQADRSSRIDLDLIRRTLEQREVMHRLRTAATDISAD